MPILASLLVRGTDDVILPAMGIIQECASEVWGPGLRAYMCCPPPPPPPPRQLYQWKKHFFNEEMVNDRKIAALGVQMFSTVLCTISYDSSNLRKHFNISCYVLFYSLRFVRISAGRGWWKELSSTWRKEMWLSRPSVQMRCSRFVLRLRFAQNNLRKVEETQITRKPTQSKI